MGYTVLSVGYPFAPVSSDTAGGAEQVLATLDSGLCARGHVSLLLGGSAEALTDREMAYRRYRSTIACLLAKHSIDLVHMHGLDFHQYLPAPGVPVLVTLHLPPSWYPLEVFRLARPHTQLVCVSESQRRACPRADLPVIPNGVAVERLDARISKRNFVLALGRICPEKGFHVALDAAARAGRTLLLGGEVFPYPEHEEYFRTQIAPRVGPYARFLGRLGFERKRRLMAAASCVLIPSLVAETSSLVAMEALACGTPVVAFPAGALPEIVEHGRTGFLVKDEPEMAAAIERAGGISPARCRDAARERFAAARMVASYIEIYEQMVNACAAVSH